VLGGIRSGKSHFAKMLASRKGSVLFIATCQATDPEMKQRIEEHKKNRPPDWEIIEEGERIEEILRSFRNSKRKKDVIIIDCLGMFITNLLKNEDREIMKKVRGLIRETKRLDSQVIVVSNEVGMSLVNPNKLARRFSDLLGEANQLVAKEADEVYFLTAGIPTKLKANSKLY
jgi:adenosylcobinamide kinase/adenosylcobinamide-phosphate guanylyltransferase